MPRREDHEVHKDMWWGKKKPSIPACKWVEIHGMDLVTEN